MDVSVVARRAMIVPGAVIMPGIDPVIGRVPMTIAAMIPEPIGAGLRRHRNGTMCGRCGTEVPTREDPDRTRGERGCRAHGDVIT